jgi:hypothetical protein
VFHATDVGFKVGETTANMVLGARREKKFDGEWRINGSDNIQQLSYKVRVGAFIKGIDNEDEIRRVLSATVT